MIKFTPNTWQRILGFTVLDPDGWDRKGNFELDWNTPLSFDEFMDKANVSICSSHPDRETMRKVALNSIVPNVPNARIEVAGYLGKPCQCGKVSFHKYDCWVRIN